MAISHILVAFLLAVTVFSGKT
jgi:xanthine/uracil permease